MGYTVVLHEIHIISSLFGCPLISPLLSSVDSPRLYNDAIPPHSSHVHRLTMTKEAKINKLLDDTSKHIEFHGFLTNHMKHAVIALHGLGADADYIEKYCSSYAKETYGFGLEPAKGSDVDVNEDNWQAYLGKHEQFEALCRFFTRRADELGLDEMLRFYVPSLLAGCVGSLFHGAIHLGWAIGAGHHGMIIEGVAYLAFSFVSCYPERVVDTGADKGDNKEVLESFLQICGDWNASTDEHEHWLEEIGEKLSPSSGFQPFLEHTGAQLRIAQVLEEGHPIIDTVPAWLETMYLKEMWKQLYKTVTLLFLTKPGSFIVLHLLTCLYGVRCIAGKLTVSNQRIAIRCYWKAMLATLFALKSFPTEKQLSDLNAVHSEAVDEAESEDVRKDWSLLFEKAIVDKEEHNAKLVFVMHMIWKEYGHLSLYREAARHFTSTPVIGGSRTSSK